MLLCLGLGLSVQAQDIKVKASLDKTSILLGDQTVLRISAEMPVNAQVAFPVLADTLSSKVRIVSEGQADTLLDKNNPGSRLISKSYVITAFDAGVQVVPALVFKSGDKDYATEALPLEVKAVAVDTTKGIYDIKQPLAVSYSFWDWLHDNWHWLLLGLVPVLALIGAWYYFRKVKKPVAVVEKAVPVLPAHVLAMDQLNALRAKKLWEQGEVKAYYSEMTDIIRVYLEKRYNIDAMEQTSDEILTGLQSAVIPDGSRTALREILLLSDLVKFAKALPVATENELSMEQAIGFISDTQPAAAPVQGVTQGLTDHKEQDGNGVV